MAIIIFIIILAFIAFLNGDSSGIQAIAKIVGGFILFIVVAYLLTLIIDYPLITMGIIVCIVFLVFIYYKAKTSTKEKHKNDNHIQDEEFTSYNSITQKYNITKETPESVNYFV